MGLCLLRTLGFRFCFLGSGLLYVCLFYFIRKAVEMWPDTRFIKNIDQL